MMTVNVIARYSMLALLMSPMGGAARSQSTTGAGTQPAPNAPASISAGDRPSTTATLAAIERMFADDFAKTPVGGMTIGVVTNGKLAWTRSYGFADMDLGRHATRKTVYRIGSITKQFTAIMYLQMLRDGKVHPTDSVVRYYPPLRTVQGPADKIDAITFDMLAMHSSGLGREPDDMRFLTGPIAGWEATLKDALPHTKIEFGAGKVHYSNIGYGTLGAALGHVAGEPYIGYVDRRILRPLNMRNTAFVPTPAMLRELAKGYEIDGTVGNAALSAAELREGRGYKIPNGQLFSTVDDLARFVAFEMGYGPAGVLAPDLIQANLRMTLEEDGQGRRFGRGFYEIVPGVVGHGGAVSGFRAGAFFDPVGKVGIVCLRNASYPTCTSSLMKDALKLLARQGAEPSGR